MADNVLTALIPTLFKTVPMVMREQVGFIPAVSRDFSPVEMDLAVGQTMSLPLSISQALTDYTPAMTTTRGTEKTPTTTTLTIANNKQSSFYLTHEEKRLLENGGTLSSFRTEQIAECFRAFTNQMEVDIGTAMDIKASRAVGTAGTTPFATNLADLGAAAKILKDNGAFVPGGMEMVGNTSAEENLGNLTQLTNVNQSGSTDPLRQGIMGTLKGFNIRVSNGCPSHVSGTASGATIDAAGNAVGDTAIPTAAAGTGDIHAGDVISLANDTANKYCVTTGVANVASASTAMRIGAPGLRKATGAVARAITVSASHAANFAFRKSAVLLFARPPIIEKTPMLDTIVVTDPFSGMSFLVCEVKGDGMTTYRVNLAWGVAVIKADAVVKIMGE